MNAFAIFGGAVVGTIVAPMILNAVNIPAAPGIGMDDFITAGVVAGAIILIDMAF